MKKLLVVFFVALCVFSCFADIAKWEKGFYVDDFGDPTTEAYLVSERIPISYGPYAWDDSRCRILVDVKYVSFDLGETVFYNDWTIKTKTPSGTTHTFSGVLERGNGRVYISGVTDTLMFLKDIVEGSRLIMMPNNPYTSDKYDFGTVTLSLEDLKQVRPNWQ